METLTVLEQLYVVAAQADCEWRVFLMRACLAALAAAALFSVGYCLTRHVVSRFLKLVLWLGPVGVIALGPFICKMAVYGSTKWRFTYENGLSDAGSWCSNDVIHAAWSYFSAYGSYVFRWCYRDLTFTNEVGTCIDEYHYLPDRLVADMSAEASVQNATNMEVVCYALYVPPPQVVTNGVYHLNGVMRSIASTNSASPSYVTPGIEIFATVENGHEEKLTPTNKPPAVSVLQSVNQQEDPQE